MTWLKLDVGLVDNEVWRDGLAARLWIWLLCRAKVARPEGIVRFSYPVAGQQLRYHDGRRHRVPGRQALRRALRRLVDGGRVVVDEWIQGSIQASHRGGAQGYITVNLCNWATYQGTAPLHDTGGRKEADTGVADSCTGTRYTKKRKRDSEKISSTRDAASRAEPDLPDGSPERALLDAVRGSETTFFRTDAKVTEAWARAMVRAYPSVATPAEVARADAWCQSHPARTKGRLSASRFLRGWFARGSERGPGRPAAADVACPPPGVVDELNARLRTAEAERGAKEAS
jgi:hypothetical protein